jgi:hypothetical protein
VHRSTAAESRTTATRLSLSLCPRAAYSVASRSRSHVLHPMPSQSIAPLSPKVHHAFRLPRLEPTKLFCFVSLAPRVFLTLTPSSLPFPAPSSRFGFQFPCTPPSQHPPKTLASLLAWRPPRAPPPPPSPAPSRCRRMPTAPSTSRRYLLFPARSPGQSSLDFDPSLSLSLSLPPGTE